MIFLRRLWFSLRRRYLEDDFDAEAQQHLELKIQQNIESGMSPAEAFRQAHLAFGNPALAREHTRQTLGFPFLESLLQDVRYAARQLRKSPGFTAVAVFTLALGIGANTAIFSAVYAVLLKPLPFQNADRLTMIYKKNPSRSWVRNAISPAEFLAWRSQRHAFEDIAAYHQSLCVLSAGDAAEADPCETVTSNLFPMLGVAPIRGRTFTTDEDEIQTPKVAILSYGLWQRLFAGDNSVIGRAIRVDGVNVIVVGIMPSGFSHLYSPYTEAPEIWLSGIGLTPNRTWNDYFAVGLLRPQSTLSQASAEMDAVSQRLELLYTDLNGWRAELMTLRSLASGDTRPILMLLMTAVMFVLLIACANVANLLLARGTGRAGEFAIRKALGASQARLMRQLLTESLLISVSGGFLGIVLAWWGNKGLAALAPPELLKSAPGLSGGTGQRWVLIFSVAIALVTTFLAGLAPAIQSARVGVGEALKETGRSALETRRSTRFRAGLVVSEIALAMVLLIGAGLMIRTLAQLRGVQRGFNPANVLSLSILLSGEHYQQPSSIPEFWRRVMTSVEALPGVEAASVSRGLPIDGWSGQFFTTDEQPDPPPGQVSDANYVVIGPHYFQALQIPLLQGRHFDQSDTQTAMRVTIVNEELARKSWPNQNPMGKQLRMGIASGKNPWLTVVGVAGNVLTQGPVGGFHPEIYVPYEQRPWLMNIQRLELVVRTASTLPPESVAHVVVEQIHAIDKDQAVADVVPLVQRAYETMATERMVVALLGSFAGLALALAMMGTYSVFSYSVAQRTREIGVRMALGAQQTDVLRLVLGGGARLALAGIAGGVVIAVVLTRLMADLLYGVHPTDPITFCAVAVVLAAASFMACYVPARRASHVDPIVALRHE